MNRTPKTALALALSAGLVFAAGNVMADDTRAQNTDRLAAADSDQPVNDTWITTKVKAGLLADIDAGRGRRPLASACRLLALDWVGRAAG